MIVSVNLTIPKYLPILFLICLVVIFIILLSILNKVSKKLKSVILGMFIPLIILSVILIVKPNMIALISAISLTSISLLSIGIWKGLYTDEDILTGVRKIFITCGLVLPSICLLFYVIVLTLQQPKILPIEIQNSTENKSLLESFDQVKRENEVEQKYKQPTNSVENFDDLEGFIDELKKEEDINKRVNTVNKR